MNREIFRKVAGLFVLGFDGTEVSNPFRKLLKETPPAGLILFRRNLENPRQIRMLTKALQTSAGNHLLIGVDEEGGRVTRLPGPFTRFPPAADLGKLYRTRRDLELIVRLGEFLGMELRSLGINTDFAPVLDLNSNPRNPIIGDRAFSRDPKRGAAAAIAFHSGLRKGGVISCGKHFPGHGDTKTDSHLTLPRVSKGRRQLEKNELYPFHQAIRAGIPMLMTAHVVYDALDPDHPATLSFPILTDLLRKKMRFNGVVISDDLQMQAIARQHSIEEAALLALQAGVDLLLVCKGGEAPALIEKVAREIASDFPLRRRLEQSLQRLLKLRSPLPGF